MRFYAGKNLMLEKNFKEGYIFNLLLLEGLEGLQVSICGKVRMTILIVFWIKE